MINILFLISNILLIHEFSIKYDLHTDIIMLIEDNNKTNINFYNNSFNKIGLLDLNDLNRKKKISLMNLDEMKKFQYENFTYEDLLNSGYSELFLVKKYQSDSSDILITFRTDGIGVYVYYILNKGDEYYDYIETNYLDYDGKNRMFYNVIFDKNEFKVSTILVERCYDEEKVLNNLKIYERNYKIKSRKFELLNFTERDSLVIFD